MNGTEQHRAIDDARRLAAEAVAEQGEHARLVEGREALHPVAIAARDHACVIREPLRAIAVGPAAVVLQGLRQVPVIKAKPWLDASGNQRIDQPVVESKPGFVDGAASLRQHPRPRHRKAVGVDPELLHQRYVFAVAVIVIAGDVAGIAARDLAGQPGICVPDARPPSVLVGGAFDLIAGGGNAPNEVGCEAGCEAGRRSIGRRAGIHGGNLIKASRENLRKLSKRPRHPRAVAPDLPFEFGQA